MTRTTHQTNVERRCQTKTDAADAKLSRPSRYDEALEAEREAVAHLARPALRS